MLPGFRHRSIDDLIAWGGPVTSVVWLFFLMSPIRSLLASPHSPGFMGVFFGEVVVFVAVYLNLVLRNTYSGADLYSLHLRCDVVLLIMLTLLSVSMTLMAGPAWIAGFLYTSAAAGCKLPTKWALTAIAILEGLTIGLSSMVGGSWVDTGQAFIFVGVIGLITSGVCRLIIIIRALEQARQQVARLAVSEERLRLARDLHDLLGHSLSLIAVKSELAKQIVRVDPEQAANEIGDIERVSRKALADVRSTVSGYRQLSLAQELAASEEILSAANIRADIDAPLAGIPSAVESVLAWAIREGVTNIVRHSRARSCSVTFDKLPDAVRCLVHNDDRGPGVSLSEREDQAFGNGLTGLAERVRAVQGQMQATRRVEGGFLLSVTVPITRQHSIGGDMRR